jgi:hypothetical protein
MSQEDIIVVWEDKLHNNSTPEIRILSAFEKATIKTIKLSKRGYEQFRNPAVFTGKRANSVLMAEIVGAKGLSSFMLLVSYSNNVSNSTILSPSSLHPAALPPTFFFTVRLCVDNCPESLSLSLPKGSVKERESVDSISSRLCLLLDLDEEDEKLLPTFKELIILTLLMRLKHLLETEDSAREEFALALDVVRHVLSQESPDSLLEKA